jgi:membrane fusion protein, multidrug efflux system
MMSFRRAAGCLGAWFTALVAASGCGGVAGEKTVGAGTAPRTVTVTVAPATRRAVERTVEVVGSLKGWEEVTLGSKKEGRVRRVLHDMGDRVKPGEPLVELETDDATFVLLQARSKYLAELTKLGITQQQAEAALKRFGVTEELLQGEEATRLIEQAPPIVQATVAVEKAQNNLNRQRQLHARNAGTTEELQNVENDFKAARAARDNAIATARNVIATAIATKVSIDSAERALQEMTVTAPQPSKRPEGVTETPVYAVTKRSVSEGQMLRVGDQVMELVIESPLRLWANVPERHSSEVKLGQPVKVKVASYPDTTFEGRVARINPSVDTVSRTFQVEAVVPNNRGLLRPGGFAKATIQVEKNAEAKVVPLEAVVRYAGVTKVFVVEGEKSRSINVETGLEGPGWVEVFGDLPKDARVVVTGQTQLADGTTVAIRDDAPSKRETPQGAPK